MACIVKRKNKDGSNSWRVIIRLKSYPTVCKTFDRKQEAEDWAQDTEQKIKRGQFRFDLYNTQHTFKDLVERFLNDGALEHHRSAKDTLRHLNYWKERLGSYGLVHITAEKIGKERKILINTPTKKGTKTALRSSATINRYFSSLSTILTYAKKLRWIEENPCFSLSKLKESDGKERALTAEEAIKLIQACKASKNLYLYCIVLIAITSGARKSEILSLKWSDVDLENKIAFLRKTKNNRPRTIPLVDEIVAELKKISQKRCQYKQLIFASKTAFGKIDIKKAWEYALQTSGINSCRFHDLRHSFATFAAQQGASSLELQTATGHRCLEMLQRYTHLEGNLTRKYSENISKQILRGQNDR